MVNRRDFLRLAGAALRAISGPRLFFQGQMTLPMHNQTRNVERKHLCRDLPQILYQCAFKEVTFCEFGPGGSPKRSQAPPFVAEEIRRDRPRPRFSMFPV